MTCNDKLESGSQNAGQAMDLEIFEPRKVVML